MQTGDGVWMRNPVFCAEAVLDQFHTDLGASMPVSIWHFPWMDRPLGGDLVFQEIEKIPLTLEFPESVADSPVARFPHAASLLSLLDTPDLGPSAFAGVSLHLHGLRPRASLQLTSEVEGGHASWEFFYPVFDSGFDHIAVSQTALDRGYDTPPLEAAEAPFLGVFTANLSLHATPNPLELFQVPVMVVSENPSYGDGVFGASRTSALASLGTFTIVPSKQVATLDWHASGIMAAKREKEKFQKRDFDETHFARLRRGASFHKPNPQDSPDDDSSFYAGRLLIGDSNNVWFNCGVPAEDRVEKFVNRRWREYRVRAPLLPGSDWLIDGSIVSSSGATHSGLIFSLRTGATDLYFPDSVFEELETLFPALNLSTMEIPNCRLHTLPILQFILAPGIAVSVAGSEYATSDKGVCTIEARRCSANQLIVGWRVLRRLVVQFDNDFDQVAMCFV